MENIFLSETTTTRSKVLQDRNANPKSFDNLDDCSTCQENFEMKSPKRSPNRTNFQPQQEKSPTMNGISAKSPKKVLKQFDVSPTLSQNVRKIANDNEFDGDIEKDRKMSETSPKKLKTEKSSPKKVSPTPVKKSVTIRNSLPHHQEHHKRASPPVNRDTQLVGKNPLACRHCQYSCLNKKELRNHLKSKHRNNMKKTQSTAKSNQKQERPNKSLSLNPNALVDIMATNFNAEIPGVGQTKPLADSRQKSKSLFDVKPNRRRLKRHHANDAENLPNFVDNVKKGVVKKSCQFCSIKCSTRKELKVHMRNNHRDKLKYKCDFCIFSSNFNAGIAYHLKTKHSDMIRVDEEIVFKSEVIDEISNTTYDCLHCQFESSSKVELESHIENEHSQKSLKCQICDFSAKTLSGLKHHKKTRHSNTSESSFVHDEAVDVFTDSDVANGGDFRPNGLKYQSTKVHIGNKSEAMSDQVEDEKKFGCGHCDYIAKTRTTLQCHVKRIHLGIRDQRCQHCPYIAGNRSDLNKHIKGVHLKTKDYKCKSCDYSCSLSSTMFQHVRAVHLKIKNHACPDCDYKSSFKGDLLKHVRSKHTENTNDVIKRIKSSSDVNNQKTKLKNAERKKKKLIESKIVRPSNEQVHFDHLPSSPKQESKKSQSLNGHKCQFCSFKCRFKRSLIKHVQVKHSGEKEGLPAAAKPEDETKQKKINCKKVKDDVNERESKNLTKNQFCFNCKFKTCQRKYLIRHFREKHPRKFKVLMKKLQKLNSSGNPAKVANEERKQEDRVRKENCKEVFHQLDETDDENDTCVKKFSCPECHFKSRFKVNVTRHLGTRHPSASVRVVILEGQTKVIDSGKVDFEKNGKERKNKLTSISTKSELKVKRISRNTKNNTIKEEDISQKAVEVVEALAAEDDKDAGDKKTRSQQLSCSKCSFVAKRHPDLVAHWDKSHLKRGTDKRCPHCNYRTTLSVLLNSHVVTNHSKNNGNSNVKNGINGNDKNLTLNVWKLFMDES